MAEAIAEQVRRSILDGSDDDLRRQLGIAETTREMARSAFRRVGMQEGWHAIDRVVLGDLHDLSHRTEEEYV